MLMVFPFSNIISMSSSIEEFSGSNMEEVNGSRWSENCTCFLYNMSSDSFAKFFQQNYPTHPFPNSHKQGFTICFQTIHIFNHLHYRQLMIRRPTTIHIIHLPPASLSSLHSVTDVIDDILSASDVPETDQDSLVNHLFSMGLCYEQTSFSTLVTILFDFNITTVFRDRAELQRWTDRWTNGEDGGGEADDDIVRTLRATDGAISELKKMSFDGGLSKMEDCTVCLECCKDGERVSRLPCSHEFHFDCIAEWLRCNHRCPSCRFPMPWIRVATSISDQDFSTAYDGSFPMMSTSLRGRLMCTNK